MGIGGVNQQIQLNKDKDSSSTFLRRHGIPAYIKK